jgi:hypothetical protein
VPPDSRLRMTSSDDRPHRIAMRRAALAVVAAVAMYLSVACLLTGCGSGGVPGASATVYITKTGKKFHRAGCDYLRKSRIPISRDEADRQGYGPCSVCDP